MDDLEKDYKIEKNEIFKHKHVTKQFYENW